MIDVQRLLKITLDPAVSSCLALTLTFAAFTLTYMGTIDKLCKIQDKDHRLFSSAYAAAAAAKAESAADHTSLSGKNCNAGRMCSTCLDKSKLNTMAKGLRGKSKSFLSYLQMLDASDIEFPEEFRKVTFYLDSLDSGTSLNEESSKKAAKQVPNPCLDDKNDLDLISVDSSVPSAM